MCWVKEKSISKGYILYDFICLRDGEQMVARGWVREGGGCGYKGEAQGNRVMELFIAMLVT